MSSTLSVLRSREATPIGLLVLELTADGSDGSFDAVSLDALDVPIDGTILAITTDPGSPAPSSGWSVTLMDEFGKDRLDGACAGRSSGTTEREPIVAPAASGENLMLTVGNNTELAAKVKVAITWTTAALLGASQLGTLDVSDAALLAAIETIAGAIHAEEADHVSTDSGLAVWGIANEAGAELVASGGKYVGRAATLKGEGYVRPTIKLITKTWTPTLDTSAYAAGDNLYTTLYEITGAARYNGGTGRIVDFFVRDGDAQGKTYRAHIFDRSVTIPAANAAWSISDADNQYRACAAVDSGSPISNTLNHSSSNPTLSVPFQCKSDSTSLWVAVESKESPTHTASGLQLGLRMEQD